MQVCEVFFGFVWGGGVGDLNVVGGLDGKSAVRRVVVVAGGLVVRGEGLERGGGGEG